MHVCQLYLSARYTHMKNQFLWVVVIIEMYGLCYGNHSFINASCVNDVSLDFFVFRFIRRRSSRQLISIVASIRLTQCSLVMSEYAQVFNYDVIGSGI